MSPWQLWRTSGKRGRSFSCRQDRRRHLPKTIVADYETYVAFGIFIHPGTFLLVSDVVCI